MQLKSAKYVKSRIFYSLHKKNSIKYFQVVTLTRLYANENCGFS